MFFCPYHQQNVQSNSNNDRAVISTPIGSTCSDVNGINIKHSSGHDKRELSKPPLILDSDIHPCKKNDANINEDYLIEVSKHSEV